jgi:hypothetical protein
MYQGAIDGAAGRRAIQRMGVAVAAGGVLYFCASCFSRFFNLVNGPEFGAPAIGWEGICSRGGWRAMFAWDEGARVAAWHCVRCVHGEGGTRGPRLDHVLGSFAGDLCGGQRRKLCISQRLVGNAPTVLTDGATAGLMRKTVSREKGAASIITSHVVEEAVSVLSGLVTVHRPGGRGVYGKGGRTLWRRPPWRSWRRGGSCRGPVVSFVRGLEDVSEADSGRR